MGAHFFSPAHIMPLLEIVRSDATSPQVVLDTLEFGSRIKKTPVVVGNCTGFAVNRVFFPYSMAAAMLVDSGLDPYRVDAAVAAFGMPMGPFRLGDLVGLDVSLFVGRSYLEAFPDRVYRSALVPLLNEAGRLGEKARKGWYVFDDKRKAKPDPALAEFVLESRKVSAGSSPCSTGKERVRGGAAARGVDRGRRSGKGNVLPWMRGGNSSKQQQIGSERCDWLRCRILLAHASLTARPTMEQRSGLSGNAAIVSKLSDQDIVEFVFFPVINEACRVVAEGGAGPCIASRTAAGCR